MSDSKALKEMAAKALQGAKKSISSFHPILMIEKIKSSESELGKLLLDEGYSVFPLGINLLAIHHSDPAVSQVKVGP